jgi:hypothetical protein
MEIQKMLTKLQELQKALYNNKIDVSKLWVIFDEISIMEHTKEIDQHYYDILRILHNLIKLGQYGISEYIINYMIKSLIKENDIKEIKYYKCPLPIKWNEIYKIISKENIENKPPIPLILNGWVYTNDYEKENRWKNTVEWIMYNYNEESILPLLKDEEKYY